MKMSNIPSTSSATSAQCSKKREDERSDREPKKVKRQCVRPESLNDESTVNASYQNDESKQDVTITIKEEKDVNGKKSYSYDVRVINYSVGTGPSTSSQNQIAEPGGSGSNTDRPNERPANTGRPRPFCFCPRLLNNNNDTVSNTKSNYVKKNPPKHISLPAWAYHVENFLETPDPELICGICHNVFCDPVQTPCEHVFCRTCITKWLNGNISCPNCRFWTTASKLQEVISLVKNLILNLELRCHNSEKGCSSTFKLERCASHIQKCPYEGKNKK